MDASPELVDHLREKLTEDRKLPRPRYPEQALYALRDERVSSALTARFRADQRLVAIRTLGYNLFTGLTHTLFDFGSPVVVMSSGILVVTDHETRVVALIDPFDSSHPNPLLPPIDQQGDQPFVLRQASVADGLMFTDEDLRDVDERSRRFFEDLGVYQDIVRQRASGLGGVTSCQFFTERQTLYGYGCTRYTGLFEQCDRYGALYTSDGSVDNVADDSGVP